MPADTWAARTAHEALATFADARPEEHALLVQLLTVAITLTVEHCAGICDDADVVEARSSYYAQLGDARATLRAAAAEIRALVETKGDVKP